MTAKASKSEAGRGYAKTDLEDVSDAPEFTADEMARAKPAPLILGAAAESGTLLLLAQNRAQPELAPR